MSEDQNINTRTFADIKKTLSDASKDVYLLTDKLKCQHKLVETLRSELQRACKHDRIDAKRESGHYGQRYHECVECGKVW